MNSFELKMRGRKPSPNLPVRRLPGDYFEISPLGTALRGRRGGRTFRLGDPIKVRVEEVRRAEGKVELSLTGGR